MDKCKRSETVVCPAFKTTELFPEVKSCLFNGSQLFKQEGVCCYGELIWRNKNVEENEILIWVSKSRRKIRVIKKEKTDTVCAYKNAF